MNGKVTLTLNNETYNVLAIVPDTNHFGKIASIYMCKPRGRNIYKTILFDNWVIRNWHFTTSGKVGDKEFAEIQARSIPFNDDIIPPPQGEAQAHTVSEGFPAVTAPEVNIIEHSNDRLLTMTEAHQSELETLRAEITKLQADVVTLTAANQDAKLMIAALQSQKAELTADNRRLQLALNRAKDGLGIISAGATGDYSADLVALIELQQVNKLLNSEVNS